MMVFSSAKNKRRCKPYRASHERKFRIRSQNSIGSKKSHKETRNDKEIE